MKRALLILLVASISLPVHAMTKSQRYQVYAGVKAQLKDSDSAKFRRLKMATKGEKVVCGEVNAKNSLGGYVGYKPFIGMIVESGHFVVIGIDSGGSVDVVCRRQGLR